MCDMCFTNIPRVHPASEALLLDMARAAYLVAAFETHNTHLCILRGVWSLHTIMWTALGCHMRGRVAAACYTN